MERSGQIRGAPFQGNTRSKTKIEAGMVANAKEARSRRTVATRKRRRMEGKR
jgi:hypothetical protein